MGQGSLLDTNIAIYYLEGVLDVPGKILVANAIAAGARISVIFKIELRSWNRRAGSLIDNTQNFVDDAIIIGLDQGVVENPIRARTNSEKMKVRDPIIAARALCFNLSFITKNMSDFSSVEALQVIDPFDP